MTTLKDFERWQRVKDKAEELFDPIGSDLRGRWKQYSDAKLDRSYDRFPDDIEHVYIHDDFVHISGTFHSRGCTDYENCRMPVKFAFGTDEEVQEIIEESTRKKAEEAKLIEQRKEEKDKAEYERLRQIFEKQK